MSTRSWGKIRPAQVAKSRVTNSCDGTLYLIITLATQQYRAEMDDSKEHRYTINMPPPRCREKSMPIAVTCIDESASNRSRRDTAWPETFPRNPAAHTSCLSSNGQSSRSREAPILGKNTDSAIYLSFEDAIRTAVIDTQKEQSGGHGTTMSCNEPQG